MVKRTFVSIRYSVSVLKYLLNASSKPMFFYFLVHKLRMHLVHAACFFIHFFLKRFLLKYS